MRIRARVALPMVYSIMSATLALVPAREAVAQTASELDTIRQAIAEQNAAFTVGENWVTRLTPAERARLLGARIPEGVLPQSLPSPPLTKPSVPALDWRNVGGLSYVSGVRDQGMCGSCWIFAPVAALESALMIRAQTPDTDPDYSEQFLLSCLAYGDGCGGGYPGDAMAFLMSTGTPSEWCFPYQADDQIPCADACPGYADLLARLVSWNVINYENPADAAIKSALELGPVVTYMDIYDDFFGYSGGIYRHVTGTLSGGHAVLIVGYDDVQRYWIAKNSFASWWGESGFFRISYDAGCRFGTWTMSCAVEPVPPVLLTLDRPTSLTVSTGRATAPIFGRVGIDGVTDAPGAAPRLVVQLGFGPDGSDPTMDPDSWEWVAATFVGDVAAEDEYSATLEIDAPGSYDYAFRCSRVGMPWVYGDLDGSGNGYAPAQGGNLAIILPVLADAGAGLPGLRHGALAWGDYDRDGDPDLVAMGELAGGTSVTCLYRNDAGLLVDAGAGLPGTAWGDCAWADYDNDGDLDLALLGVSDWMAITRIFRNDDGVFTDTYADLPDLSAGMMAWGDCDNDGDLDLFLAGQMFGFFLAQLYRNDAGSFTLESTFPGVGAGDAAWADFDGDGDLDLVFSGVGLGVARITRLYRNQDGYFEEYVTDLPDMNDASVAWGDCDGDGDPDLLVSGETDSGLHSAVYRNDAGTFVDLTAGLPPASGGSACWGDVDNDGDLDILLTGYTGTGSLARIYRNDGGGVFTDLQADLPGVYESASAWADFDGDGDLDLALAGFTGAAPLTQIRLIGQVPVNTPPLAPANPQASLAGGVLTLSWNAASDAETPAAGLSYNVRIGTTAGGGEIMSAMALSDGRRLLANRGNAQQRLSWSIVLPASWAQLDCGLQAVDAAFAGSPFAALTVSNPSAAPEPAVPSAYALHANVPNPFNPLTSLVFDLPAAGRTRFEVFDARGRRIRVLLDEVRPAGRHETTWDGTDAGGRALASGVYLCRMEAGAFRRTLRMTLVR